MCNLDEALALQLSLYNILIYYQNLKQQHVSIGVNCPIIQDMLL